MPTDFGLFLRVVTRYGIGDVRFEFDLSVSHTFINVAEPPPLKTVQSVSGRSSSEILNLVLNTFHSAKASSHDVLKLRTKNSEEYSWPTTSPKEFEVKAGNNVLDVVL